MISLITILVLTVCLRASLYDCETREVELPNVGWYQCYVGAQPFLAQWIDSHPGYTIIAYTCLEGRAA